MGENIAKSGSVRADSSNLRRGVTVPTESVHPTERVATEELLPLSTVSFPTLNSRSRVASESSASDSAQPTDSFDGRSPLSSIHLPSLTWREGIPALMAERLLPLQELPSGVMIYGPAGMTAGPRSPERPLKVAILTSIRDVGAEEGVGLCWRPGDSATYLKGTIETALEAVNDHRLGDVADIVAIITDDTEKDLRGSSYVASPDREGTWIFPRELRNRNGELASALTVNIPSSFRALPQWDFPARIEGKAAFEGKIAEVIEQSGADILISDHFLARIQYLIDPECHGLLGRVLNTHPGITREDHPYPCRGKCPDEVAFKHLRGERVLEDGSTIRVRPHRLAGASFHFVTRAIDAGPVLCDGELTELSPSDTNRDISRKVYATSKEPVFIEGLRHYAANFFPEIGRMVPLREGGQRWP